ncbi:Dihydrodipicolinate synthase [Kocuria rosea]|nr:Dihydrodipicolinate synthase [Kocuria rosea]
MDSIRAWIWGLLAAALLTLWLLPVPGGSKLWILAVLVFAGVFTLLESTSKAKLLAAAMVTLLVVYLGLSLHRAVLLLGTDGWIAKAFGVAMLVLPAVGVWALVREILFGVRTEQLGRTLHEEGGLPPDDLPRTPGGRRPRRTRATGATGTGSPWPTRPPGTGPAPAPRCATPWPSPAGAPPATWSPPTPRARAGPDRGGEPPPPARRCPRRGGGNLAPMTANASPSSADLPATRSEPLFGTLLTAMITVFAADGSVDLDATAAMAVQLVDDGCDGLVVCGTTGEYSTMTDEENLSVFRAVKEAVGSRVPLLAGTGSNDTEHSRYLSRAAEKLGMDGLLIVTPYYNKPSQAGVEAHFRSLADSVDLPIMLYDIPGRAGIPIATETLISLAGHPNIVAVKDAKADLVAATRVLAETDLLYYSGDDGLTLPWMAIGAAGLIGVTTHVATARYRELVDAVRAQDLAAARRINAELEPVVRATMTRAPGAVAAKTILMWQGRLPHNTVRLPHVPPTEAEAALIRADLRGSVVADTLLETID